MLSEVGWHYHNGFQNIKQEGGSEAAGRGAIQQRKYDRPNTEKEYQGLYGGRQHGPCSKCELGIRTQCEFLTSSVVVMFP